MAWEIVALVFLLGASIGSFINAWSFRALVSHRSLLSPSACNACSRRLAWYELFPLASFLVLRGKCRSCSVSLSLQYPLVELLTGIVFVLIWYHFSVHDFSSLATHYSLLTTHWLFWSIIIALSIYDFRTTIIPDHLTLAAGALAFALHPENLFAGLLLAAPLAAFWLFSRGRWMGLGDAKLQLGLGFLLGTSIGFAGMLFGFWLGALAGLALMIMGRAGMKTEVPFGPFLALGAFLAWVLQFDMIGLI
jgi:leader peptidase (prepilin peptidase)/N-methyltransferase